jgi:hypothetical protein
MSTAGSVSVTINDNPSIILSAGNSSQSLSVGQSLSPLTYTINNAAAAYADGAPPGISVVRVQDQLFVSGSVNSVGTYDFTVVVQGEMPCAPAYAYIHLVISSTTCDALFKSFYATTVKTRVAEMQSQCTKEYPGSEQFTKADADCIVANGLLTKKYSESLVTSDKSDTPNYWGIVQTDNTYVTACCAEPVTRFTLCVKR